MVARRLAQTLGAQAVHLVAGLLKGLHTMMQKFVINRSTLLTGAARKVLVNAGFTEALYDSMTGLSDVVGQYLLAQGVKKSALDGRFSPEHLTCELPSEAKWLLANPTECSAEANEVLEANDDPRLHQIRREARIAKVFAGQHIKASFVGSYREATKRAKLALAA